MPLPSLCGVLEARRPRKLPKQHRLLLPREDSRFAGSGFIPFTFNDPANPGNVSLLLFRKDDQPHLHDFGGSKSSPEESVVECASRYLTEETFGLLSLEVDRRDSGHVVESLKDIHFGGGKNLLYRCSAKWIACQLVSQPDFSSHFNEKEDYFVTLIPIDFVDSRILDSASDALEGGKRRYHWIPLSNINETPLIPRLAITSLMHAKVVPVHGEVPVHDCVILN